MSFRPFFNPATGEWTEYTTVAEDSDGELVRFAWRSMPGGVISEHIHPHQEERFTIDTGEAHFTLHGEEHVATAGETIVVPPGVPHSEGNSGSVEIKGVVELRPALPDQGVPRGVGRARGRREDHSEGGAEEPAAARRHVLALPPREPDDVASYLDAEPGLPTAVGVGTDRWGAGLLRALGQPCCQ